MTPQHLLQHSKPEERDEEHHVIYVHHNIGDIPDIEDMPDEKLWGYGGYTY
jgi:hypothetical protein